MIFLIALFRFELLNYLSIPVELRITYLLPIGLTNESVGKSHKRPILPTLTAVLVSRGSCRHLSARSGKPAISTRQHTNSMCVDIGTQYPHKHHASFTLCQQVKDPRFHKNGDRLSPSRRGLTPRRRRVMKHRAVQTIFSHRPLSSKPRTFSIERAAKSERNNVSKYQIFGI